MSVTREEVVATLALCQPSDLRAILEAARVSPRRAETARDLGGRIADAIWWNYSTPAGYLAGKTELTQIVAHVAKRLRINDAVTSTDAWEALDQMTLALAAQHGPTRADELDETTQRRLSGSWMGAVGLAGSAGTSAGAGIASHYFLEFAKTPVGRLLPFVPTLGPIFKGVKTGAGVVSIVSWPLALGLGVASINSSLGANYRRLVPLLLGIGALGPSRVEDAEVIDQAV
jgi:hypothetical protein